MSSPSSKPPEINKVDAIVLAGSRGARLFELNGRKLPKPYLKLGGEPLVRRVVRALLASERVGKVYVIGQPDLLEESLGAVRREVPERLRLVEEGQDILDNCYRAFFLHLLPERKLEPIASPHLDPEVISEYRQRFLEQLDLPAFFITADLPFIDARAIEEFLEEAPREAAVVMGLVDHQELERMHAVLGAECALDYWKLGALQLRHQAVRLNNLFLVRPLQVDPAFYRLLIKLYAHRWLLKQDGSVNFKNWWAIAKATISYSLRLRGFFRFLRGIINFVPATLASCLAKFTHRFSRWLSWPFRLFVSKRDVEFICSLMMGARGHLIITRDPGSAIDVDVEESYRSLVSNGERDYQRIARYLEMSRPGRGGASSPSEQDQPPQAQSQQR